MGVTISTINEISNAFAFAPNKKYNPLIFNFMTLKRFFSLNDYPNDIAKLIIKYYSESFEFKFEFGTGNALLLCDKTIYSCGKNDLMHKNNIFSKTNLGNIRDISCNSYINIALDYNDNVYMWGTRYKERNLICIYPPEKMHLSKIRKIYSDFNYSYAITYENEVYIWGPYVNGVEKMNLTNVKKIYLRNNLYIALTYSGDVYMWGDFYLNELPIDYNFPEKIELTNIKKIALGNEHIIALDGLGDVYGWGSNEYGQLGLEKSDIFLFPIKLDIANVKNIHCGHNRTIFTKENNEIFGCGDNEWGQLGIKNLCTISYNINAPTKSDLTNIKKIYCENNYTFALSNSGELYACGYYRYDISYSNSLKKINLPPIKKFFCKNYNFVAIDIYNEIYVWGDNDGGKLGAGDYNKICSPQKIEL